MDWPTVAPADIASRWRPLTPDETTVAETRILDATAELQMQLRMRGVLEPLDDEPWQRLYVRTVADMVRRYLMNPEAWLEETTRLDDWSETRRRDSAVSAGLIYVSDDELDKLVPGMRRKRGAFTARLGLS